MYGTLNVGEHGGCTQDIAGLRDTSPSLCATAGVFSWRSLLTWRVPGTGCSRANATPVYHFLRPTDTVRLGPSAEESTALKTAPGNAALQ